MRGLRCSISCLVVVVSLAYALPALGVQASGPLIVVPIPPAEGPPGLGDPIDVAVGIENTSTNTPSLFSPQPDPFAPVEAVLGGSVFLRTPCPTESCEYPLTVFMPVGSNGCVESDPAVTGCHQSAPGEVAITLQDTGLALPPASSVQLATVRVRIQDAATIGFITRLDLEGATHARSLRACSFTPSECAFGASFGASVISFIHPPALCAGCRSTLRFAGDPPVAKLEVRGKSSFGASFGPDNGVRVNLSRSHDGVQLMDALVPPGSLLAQGQTVLLYRNARAIVDGGVSTLRLQRRADGTVVFRLLAYEPQLAADATDPEMTISLVFGNNLRVALGPWIRRPWGWQLPID